jgi:hypothetical protein
MSTLGTSLFTCGTNLAPFSMARKSIQYLIHNGKFATVFG